MTSYITQNTVSRKASCNSVGVHSGEIATLTLKPAPENNGITFIRTDITGKNNVIPASWDAVSDTRMCTVLSNKDGISISTVEHVLSALCGTGIDNAIVEVDGPEIPIMDGSSAAFVELIKQAGIQEQSAPRKFLLIKSAIKIEQEDKTAELLPAATQSFHFTIDFDSKAVGEQSYDLTLASGDYNKEISPARTFGFLHEVEALRSMGLAKGGSLENAVVIDGDNILNPEGLRYKTEFTRHKLLDAIGDMFLSGGQIIGHYHGIKASHQMNNELLHKLFATEEAFELVTLTEQQYRAMTASTLAISEQRKNGTFFVIGNNASEKPVSY